jgi:hypothetical protein
VLVQNVPVDKCLFKLILDKVSNNFLEEVRISLFYVDVNLMTCILGVQGLLLSKVQRWPVEEQRLNERGELVIVVHVKLVIEGERLHLLHHFVHFVKCIHYLHLAACNIFDMDRFILLKILSFS